jgi:hypothetical protein
MKRVAMLAGIFVICVNLCAWAADDPANFSGTWILDSKNSDPFPHPIRDLGAPGMVVMPGGMGGGMPGGMGGGMPGGMGGGMPGGMGGGMPGGMGGGIPGGGMPGTMPGGGAGGMKMAEPKPLVIQQNGSEVQISQTMIMNDKEIPMAEKYKLDGSEDVKMMPVPNIQEPVKVVTTATLKKNKIKTRRTTYIPKNKGDLKKEYSLSKDGKTLTVNTTNTTIYGDLVQKQIYHKQE